MKKFLKLFVVALVALSLVACGGEKAEPTTTPEDEAKATITVGFVTDTGGIADKSFNQTSYEGAVKYMNEVGGVIGTDLKYLESKNDADYVPNLSTFADEGVDLIAAAGFLFCDAMTEVATQYPDQKMVIIDTVVEGENVLSATFNEHEGSFLVGVVAGLAAKEAGKDTVGYVTGMESETMGKFCAGYEAGVWAVYPECKVLYANANDFANVAAGKAIADAMYNAGAYVIFHAAGGTGTGVINAASERRIAGEDVWAIGVDTDQHDLGIYTDANGEEHSSVLTSMMKRVDVAVYDACKAIADGSFKGGVRVLSLADGGVGLAPSTQEIEATNPEWLNVVAEYEEKIKSGEIVVPTVQVSIGENDLVSGVTID